MHKDSHNYGAMGCYLSRRSGSLRDTKAQCNQEKRPTQIKTDNNQDKDKDKKQGQRQGQGQGPRSCAKT